MASSVEVRPLEDSLSTLKIDSQRGTQDSKLTVAEHHHHHHATFDDGRDYYEEVSLEGMDLDEDAGVYTYQCPCGDKFTISFEDLCNGEEIARCPSCTLIIRVLYDPNDFLSDEGDDDS